MVKVISAYNFQQQNTYLTAGDVVATCLISTDRLALAHRNHVVEILPLRRQNSESVSSNKSNRINKVDIENACSMDQNENLQTSKIGFPTVDQVDQLMYCASKDYILTLENKTEAGHNQSFKHHRFVRVYTNFDIASTLKDCFSIPTRARIASRTTPIIDSSDHLEVIEIPVNVENSGTSPHLVTCCQTSGTIAICCDRRIHIFESRHCMIDTTKFQYLDFFEAPFYVQLDVIPLKIGLAEHVIVCMDTTLVLAFKILDIDEGGTDDETTNHSLATDSFANLHGQQIPTQLYNENKFSNNKINKVIDFELAKQYNQANDIDIHSDIQSNWDRKNTRRSPFSEECPCLVNDVNITLVNSESFLKNHRPSYIIRSLLQLRLQPRHRNEHSYVAGKENLFHKEPIIKGTVVHDEFRCLALKPIFLKIDSKLDQLYKKHYNDLKREDCNGSGHIMKSKYHKNCVGFSLFISTVSDGYIYQFTNQGKWYAENSKCLAVYPFTSPVIDIVIDNFVIHAITESGIETFSSRIGHKLFSNYFEYPMINNPYPDETSPLVDVPICVMGICGFFGIKYIVSSAQNLILVATDNEFTRLTNGNKKQKGLSKVTQATNCKNHNSVNQIINRGNNNEICLETLEWTIYDLELPKPETLVDDISNLALIYRQSCPDIYYELLEEAHVIIRLARELFVVPVCSQNQSLDWNDFTSNANGVTMLEETYTKTCKMLADFTIRSRRKEIYSQAVTYYSMCRYSILDIYTSYHETNNVHNNCSEDNLSGLIYTISLLLSRIGSNKSGIKLLTQHISMNCTCNDESNPRQSFKKCSHFDRLFAEELFEFFLKYSPGNLTQIALCSSVFREILNDRVCQHYIGLGDPERLSPDQKICLVLCLCYKKDNTEALRIFETLQRSHLYFVLCKNWSQLLFENSQSRNCQKSSFSDFAESILFVTRREELVEAVADVIIRILAVMHSVDLHFIIKLFMNYFAMNIGCPGYKNSQKILETVLQAYFYDLYKYNSRNAVLSQNDSARQTEIGSTLSGDILQQFTMSSSHSSRKNDQEETSLNGKCSIINSHNDEKYSTLRLESPTSSRNVDSSYEDPDSEAMKILFRMYLGHLNQHAVGDQLCNRWMTTTDISTLLPDVNCYRVAFINYLYRNKDLIKTTHCKQDVSSFSNPRMRQVPIFANNNSYNGNTNIDQEYWHAIPFHRPIVFFERRENFLNKMPPLCLKTDTNGATFPNNWHEINLILIKLQSLLNSGKLEGSLIEDVIEFVNSNPNVIGIDSLLAILLPEFEGTEFLVHTNPQFLLDYAKARLTVSNQWQDLLQRVTNKKHQLSVETQQPAIEVYDRVVTDILRHLISTKTLDEFLDCVPEQEINRHHYPFPKDISYWKFGKCHKQAQDGIDESNPFEMIMREAVVKQRSDALHTMLQSSGRQLNEAVNSFQLAFN